MRTSRIILIAAGIAAIAAGYYFLQPEDSESQENVLVPVEKASLYIAIQSSGELIAKRSEKIKGPDGLRTVGIYNVTIQNLVPEGTVVKEGEFIASLDRTELDTKIKDAQAEVDKILTQLEQTKIDTAIEMRGLRDDLINLKYSMEEKKLQLELSKYEPKAVYDQAELDLRKSEREYDQLENKLQLTKDKSVAQVGEIDASLRQQQLKLNRLVEFQQKMTILAPKEGMVIYARDWNGKRGPGSQISPWDPTVAELPDLSEMVAKAYVNEVDISKVMLGQICRVTVDAFPGKEFPGMVVTKANIGEQVRNYDTKVFEVKVILQVQDSLLRPAMTAGIRVLVDSIADCLQIPIDAIQSDSVSYVFVKNTKGYAKKEVVTGPSNDMSIAIAAGLEEGEIVSLNTPRNANDLVITYLDPGVKEAAIQALEDDERKRRQVQQDLAAKVSASDLPEGSQQAQASFIIF